MKLDRERFKKAMAHFDERDPDFHKEAVHALDNFFDMLDALKAVQGEDPYLSDSTQLKVNDAVANAENTGD